jgi:hypothetical protein
VSAAAHIGGSSATAATRNYHVARLVLSTASDPNAEYDRFRYVDYVVPYAQINSNCARQGI